MEQQKGRTMTKATERHIKQSRLAMKRARKEKRRVARKGQISAK
jgi:hypothetical protein